MSFYDRIRHSQIATENLKKFLGGNVDVQGFGIESIGDEGSRLRKYLSLLSNNYNSPTAMMLEYLPDYIVYYDNKVFFLEAKVSVTPCWSRNRIADANQRADSIIDASNCGEIAREPFLAYRKYFPDAVILYVNNYNRNSILAQYAKNIQCLRCEKNRNERYDCELCPLLTGGFFDSVERNMTRGSGTPSTNINLDSFIPARIFFENEFGICINENEIRDMEESVLAEGLSFGSAILEQKKDMIRQIWNRGNHRIKCPLCGGDLVQRVNSQTGQPLLGCSNFTRKPERCKFLVTI